MDYVLNLARQLNVEHKIDTSLSDDVNYCAKWKTVLEKVCEFKKKCTITDSDVSIYNIKNPRTFSSDNNKLNMVLEQLHEDFDDFPVIDTVNRDLAQMTSMDGGGVEAHTKYPTGHITLDVHVIDVDYEYDYATGLNIIMYSRIIGSDDTVFVRCPYKDYFYVQVTDDVSPELITKSIKGYCWFLTNIKYKDMAEKCDFSADNRRHPINMDLTKPLVISTETVHGLKSMYGYQPDDQTFVKVTTVNPTVTRDLFNGLTKKYNGETREEFVTDRGTGQKSTKGFKKFPEMKLFEATTDVVNKFLTEHKISGCSAVRVKGTRVGDGPSRFSTCTLEVECDSVTPLPDAPFYEPRTFFYDIECLSLNINEFPTSDMCPIIQISYLLAKGTEVVDKGVLCYKETPGYDWYDTEEQMLIAFAKKIVDFNPDNITGFNSNCFDMPYILDRMRVLKIDHIASCWSRRLNLQMKYKRDFKQSKQFGTKEVVKYNTPGRVMFDQMEIIKGNPMIRLRSYALKSICAEFLGDDNKEDLRYKDIPDLFKTIEGRQKIASYCLQDTVLLKKLDDKMMLGVDIAGQAKVQGITTNVVLNRGLVFRIMCKIKQSTEKYGFLIPSFSKAQFPNSPTYQGATVLNCDAGYYTDPVVVLDFASLYPSLIRSYNLDYTTIAMDKEVVNKYPERFQKFDNGYAFVKSEYLRGLLPRIEAELAIERTNAKKKMKNAKDPIEKAVWNAVQGGVKIVMNSIYGLAGSPTATVPCVPIASTITFMGRTNLQASKEYVEANYCRITGEEKPCKVIYGDTDSIFILMPGIDNATAIKHGQKLDENIKSELFGHLECLVMEYEKTFNPYIQVTPKRYAGFKMEFDSNKGKVSASGLQLVKRDSALLCKRTMTTFFDYLLVKKDKDKALESIKVQLSDLFANNLPLEDFEITKKISKKPDAYKTVPPHIVAWQRMVDRVGVTEAPAVGERFAYIIEKFGKKDKLSDVMVDTDLVREKGFDKFNLAKEHYFNLYVYNPMHVITELVYGKQVSDRVLNPKAYENVETITAKKGNILGFFGKEQFTKKRKWHGLGVDDKFVDEIRQMRISDYKIEEEVIDDGEAVLAAAT